MIQELYNPHILIQPSQNDDWVKKSSFLWLLILGEKKYTKWFYGILSPKPTLCWLEIDNMVSENQRWFEWELVLCRLIPRLLLINRCLVSWICRTCYLTRANSGTNRMNIQITTSEDTFKSLSTLLKITVSNLRPNKDVTLCNKVWINSKGTKRHLADTDPQKLLLKHKTSASFHCCKFFNYTEWQTQDNQVANAKQFKLP